MDLLPFGRGSRTLFLYDNETDNQDKLKAIINKYKRYITAYKIKGVAQQFNAYNHCLANHRNDTHWLATIDLDEFLVPNKSHNLKEVMSNYEDFNGVGINWLMFGSNGHETVDDNYSVIERFNRCAKPDFSVDHSQKELGNRFESCSHIKTVANNSKVSHYDNPHFVRYLDKGFSCDGNMRPITGENAIIGLAGTDFVNHEIFQINHYHLKSWEEFRRRKSIPTADRKIIPEMLKPEHLRNTFDNLNILHNNVENNRARDLSRLLKGFDNL